MIHAYDSLTCSPNLTDAFVHVTLRITIKFQVKTKNVEFAYLQDVYYKSLLSNYVSRKIWVYHKNYTKKDQYH